MRSTYLITAAALPAVALSLLAACGSAENRKTQHFQQGERYFAAHQYSKAALEFRNALQVDPNFVQAHIELGRTSDRLGDPRAALGQYQAVIDAAPTNTEARVLAGRIYLIGGFPQKALDLVAVGLTTSPGNAQLLTVRGSARARLGDVSGALTDAEAAYQSAPDDEYGIALLASLRQNSGRIDDAVRLVKGAIDKHPESTGLREVLVNLLVQQRDYATAEAQLKDTVALEPRVLDHRYALGRFYLARNDVDAAEKVLRDAVALEPANDEPKLALVEMLASHRGADAAEAALADFARRDPKDYDLRLLLARYLEQSGRSEQAEHICVDIIEHADSERPKWAARDRLAALRLRAGNTADAARLIDAVLHDNPRDNEALMMRADMALTRGDATAAIADLRAALRDQPDSQPVLRTLARAHVANKQLVLAEETLRGAVHASPGDVTTRMQLAELLAQTRKDDEARALLVQVTADAPGNLAAQEALFRMQAQHKDYPGARATAAAVMRALPRQGIGNYLLGTVDEADGKPDAAAHDYENALTIQPDGAEPLAALVRLDISRGQSKRALDLLDSTIAKSATNAVAHNLRGEVLSSLGRSDDAAKAYEAAIALVPNWWAPYQNLSRTQMAAHHTDQALATLADGVKRANDNYTLAAELAALYELVGEPERAIGVYDDMLSRNPKSVVVASNLAMLLVSYHTDPASLQRARTLTANLRDSGNPTFQDALGWVKFKSGEYRQALPLLQAAAAESPGSMLMRYHLGMAQLKTGDRDAARKNLEAAVTSGRPFLGIGEAKLALSQLTHNG
jgi:tetratricopeptide (TPR) repeat protein